MRFIKDFSEVALVLPNSLTKDAPFVFDESCVKAFEKASFFIGVKPYCTTP